MHHVLALSLLFSKAADFVFQVLPKHINPLRGVLEALAGSEEAGLSSEELMDLFSITSKQCSMIIRPFMDYFKV